MSELATLLILSLLAYACYYLLTGGDWLMVLFFQIF